jgi:hypothetical protein
VTTTADLAGRVFDGILGTYDTWAIYVGDKLGFYREMRDGAPLVADVLAQKTGVNSRYAHEGLELQAVFGFVTCDNPAAPASERLYPVSTSTSWVATTERTLEWVRPTRPASSNASSIAWLFGASTSR